MSMCSINPRRQPNYRKYTNNLADFTDTHVVPKPIQGFMTTYETSKCPAVMADATSYLVTKIQDGSQLTGSTNISETMTYTINIPTANLWHSTMTNSQEVHRY